MKKLPFILTFIFLLLIYSNLNAQVNRMVVVEEFTNASCPPCAAQNPAFNALLDQNLNHVIPIKYQTSFPGFDPYNRQNPGEVSERAAYYSIGGVPGAVIDGVSPNASYGGGVGNWDTWYAGAPGGFTQAALNFAAAQETFIEILIDLEYQQDFSKADVYVTVVNHDSIEISGDLRLHLLLLEVENIWAFPPGSTDERDFTHVMRKMYPNAQGTALTSIGAGDTLNFSFEAEIPEYIYALDEMVFAAFLQNHSSREIFNGAITEKAVIDSIYADMAILFKNTIISGPKCGRTANLGLRVRNSGLIDVEEYTVVFDVGGEIYNKHISEVLQPGQDVTIRYDNPISLPSGDSEINYFIENVNGGAFREVNTLNNIVLPDPFSAYRVTPWEDFLIDFENFEGGTISSSIFEFLSPNNFFIRTANQSPTASYPLGGFGNSESSIFVNFRGWRVPIFRPDGEINIFDNAGISGLGTISISFDIAHAQFTKNNGELSNDKLELFYSFDCGQSWESLYVKSGDELATVTPQNEIYYPHPDDWRTETLILNNTDGADHLMFRFEVTSDNGNSLFIDNIRVQDGSTNVRELSHELSYNLFPNPTNGLVSLELNLESRQSIQMDLFSSNGKFIRNITSSEVLESGTHQFNWNIDGTGAYFVRLFDGNRYRMIPVFVVK
ncbi:MAG: T9SS C-terminal target domain-containing protein [Saprospirales bacterium]|nr:MAG: T9SS C-terminal target domain-containing protein [Saprospirales bacterium]